MALNGLADNLAFAWPLDWFQHDQGEGAQSKLPFTHEIGATVSIAGFLRGSAKSWASGTGNRMAFADPTSLLSPSGQSWSAATVVKAVRTANAPYLAKWDAPLNKKSWIFWTRSTGNDHRLSIARTGGGAEDNLVSVDNPDTVGTAIQLVCCGWDAVNKEIWISRNGAARTKVAEATGPWVGDGKVTIGWLEGSSKTMGTHDQDETLFWSGRTLSDADVAAYWNGGSILSVYEFDHSDEFPQAQKLQDGTNVKQFLVSWYDLTEAAGARVDAHGTQSGNPTEVNGPIAQAVGNVASGGVHSNNADLTGNPVDARYFEVANPVGMSPGAGSFTLCGLARYDLVIADEQAICSRWAVTGNNRMFRLYYHDTNPRGFVFEVSGTGLGVTHSILSSHLTSAGIPGTLAGLVFAWYDGVAKTINIQHMGFEEPQSAAGPAQIYTPAAESDAPFRMGFMEEGNGGYLDGNLANVGYFNGVLTQAERNYVFNYHRQRLYSEFPAFAPPPGTGGANPGQVGRSGFGGLAAALGFSGFSGFANSAVGTAKGAAGNEMEKFLVPKPVQFPFDATLDSIRFIYGDERDEE